MYQGASLATFDRTREPKAYEAASAFVAAWPPKPHILVLASNTKGNGKTTLASAILNEVARRHKRYGRFEGWPDLVAEMRGASRPDSPTTLQAVSERLAHADILVLDDVGATKQTEFVDEQLFLEVNRRYALGQPMVITTNTWSSLNDRVTSRLSDKQRSNLIVFTSPDARQTLEFDS